MNYTRVILAGFVGTVVYFACGFLVLGKLIGKYYAPYTAVYRPADAIMHYFPIGIVSTLLAIVVLAGMYAKGYEGGAGWLEGARFGFLVGLFVVFAVVGDEYVTLNIGRELAIAMAVGRLIGWVVVGTVIGLVYKPLTTPCNDDRRGLGLHSFEDQEQPSCGPISTHSAISVELIHASTSQLSETIRK